MNKNEKQKNVKTVLRIDTDFENSTYNVSADEGSSVNEMAFAIMALIRILEREGKVESRDVFLDMIKKYYDDPQYKEVEDGQV